MSEHGTALVLYESRPQREQRKARRERQVKLVRVVILGVTVAIMLMGSAWALLGMVSPGDSVAQPAANVAEDGGGGAAPPPPPTTPGVTLIPPIRVTATSEPPKTHINVQAPGWDGPGLLLTDGYIFPRLLPGETGRSIIQIPADPRTAATVNTPDRSWRVVTRSTIPEDELSSLAGAPVVVPTVVLVSQGPGILAWVEAR